MRTCFTQATRFYVNGHLVQDPPTFRPRERVRILVHQEQDNSLRALRVAVGTGANGSDDEDVLVGKVVTAAGNALTVRQADNDLVTVKLLASTIYYVNGVRVPSRPVFEAGKRVRVNVHVENDFSLDARVVRLK